MNERSGIGIGPMLALLVLTFSAGCLLGFGISLLVRENGPQTVVMKETVVIPQATEFTQIADTQISPATQVIQPTQVSQTGDQGKSRENPLPFGATGIADDMAIVIHNMMRPADDLVKAANAFNPHPDQGYEYVAVSVVATCQEGSADKCNINQFSFKLVGQSGIVYEPALIVIEGELNSGEFFGGGREERNSSL